MFSMELIEVLRIAKTELQSFILVLTKTEVLFNKSEYLYLYLKQNKKIYNRSIQEPQVLYFVYFCLLNCKMHIIKLPSLVNATNFSLFILPLCFGITKPKLCFLMRQQKIFFTSHDYFSAMISCPCLSHAVGLVSFSGKTVH